jgi:hypothetical protein
MNDITVVLKYSAFDIIEFSDNAFNMAFGN